MKNCIYKIENNINSKIYIGSAEKFNLRYNQHKHHLLKGTHHSRILQNFVNKYGFECLSFKIIEENVFNLIDREQFYIDKLNPFFNIRKIANSMKGTKRTDEQKKYMLEQRLKKSGYVKNRFVSEETRKKISEAHKGKKISEEAIRKCKETRIKNNSYKLTEEQKEKRRIISTGRKHTEETKLKISKLRKGKGNGMYGKTKELHHNYKKQLSEETKQKMRNKGKKIIDTNTGIIYDNISDLCFKKNIPKGTMSKYLIGIVKSVQNYKYYE